MLLNEFLTEAAAASNKDSGAIVLSEAERYELFTLLGEVLQDRSLIVGLAFVDGIVGANELTEEQLREIYLSERKRAGKTRALASKQWADFLTRMGRQSGWSRWGVASFPMRYEYFLEMEQRLFGRMKFPHRVSEYLWLIVSKARERVEEVLAHQALPRPNLSLSRYLKSFVIELQQMLASPVGDAHLSSRQIAALVIVLTNTSVLFTTRDWSAAGTMSAIAGGTAELLPKD